MQLSIAYLPEGFITETTFKIDSTKLYVSVVNLSTNNDIRFLKRHKARIQKNNVFE